MAPDLLPVDTEHHVLAGLVAPQSPEELSVRLPPLGHRGQHLVVQQQLPDGVCQGPVHTSLTLKRVGVAHSSVYQQVFNLEVGHSHSECYETALSTDQLQVPTETGVVEGRGVPLVPDVEIHLLVLGEVPWGRCQEAAVYSERRILTPLARDLRDDNFGTDLVYPFLDI